MSRRRSILFALLFVATPLWAQQPFYTDDPAVTDRGAWHLECFDEIDGLQRSQLPNLKQNTTNCKANVGLPHNLELDLDSPYIGIFRALGTLPQNSNGIGDLNLGVKWNFHKEAKNSRVPAFGVSFYIEFPTGDTTQELGSGLTDYALNFMIQKHLSETTRMTANGGMLFAGNTSTGVVGINGPAARVYTGGVSLLHDINARWTVGTEVYGGYTDNDGLARTQLQVMAGATYKVRNGLSLAFGMLGGKYVGSPRIGAQVGFAIDFPEAVR